MYKRALLKKVGSVFAAPADDSFIIMSIICFRKTCVCLFFLFMYFVDFEIDWMFFHSSVYVLFLKLYL